LLIYLTPFRFLLGDPIPCIPFPLLRGRGVFWKEGLTPLLNAPTLLTQSKEILREAEPLFYILFPLPYQGRGIKGVGCQINVKGDRLPKSLK